MPPIPAPTSTEFGWILASYAIGCFAGGYYWTRWRTGLDIRELGSGYVGGRNVGRLLGPSGFAVTFLLDFGKGALAVAGAQWLALRPAAIFATITAVILGHIWPVQLGFRGGKGIAVTLGALLVYNPVMAVILLALFAPVFAVLRAFTLSGMIAFLLSPAAALAVGMDRISVAAMSVAALLVLVAHRGNLRRDLARLAVRRAQEPLAGPQRDEPHDHA